MGHTTYQPAERRPIAARSHDGVFASAIRLALMMLVTILSFSPASGQDRPIKRFLLFGIDGCRTDALLEANTPNMKALIRAGAFSGKCDVVGAKKTGADTVSAPGWTTMLTGVWADKHGVRDNGFSTGRNKFGTFFSRLRVEDPKATTLALVTWKGFTQNIFVPADNAKLITDGSTTGFDRADRMVAESAARFLVEDDVSALFVFFGQVDAAGHQHGFHPKVDKYVRAIAAVDANIGLVMEALPKRPNHAREDWLVMIGADHGGRGTGHFNGHSHDEVRRTFLILHGPSVEPGVLREPTANVDVAATALTHLGLKLQPEWKLDGRVIGLKAR